MEREYLNQWLLRASAQTKLEQDLLEKSARMSEILEFISRNRNLSMLAFKGGSALNFAYLKQFKRLSIDLDFNAIGRKDWLMKIRDEMIEPAIYEITRGLGYDIEPDKNYALYQYKLYYDKMSGGRDCIKIEISFLDRVAVLTPIRKLFFFPLLNRERTPIQALAFEELLAEKLRALYTRESGRDLFDVYNATKTPIAPAMKTILRKTLIYKLFRASGPVAFKPKKFMEKIRNFKEREYENDLKPFVPEENYIEFEEAKTGVIKALDFLKQMDERDETFIGLMRCCLGEDVSKQRVQEIRGKEFHLREPLSYLFNGSGLLSEAARNTPLTEILPVRELPLQKYSWLEKFGLKQ
ncbi:nucleotidyl transferase AbiEii/AbiGii toxin family protein [Candidatus Micrarchaeota archaeon]|nr:nucleotidyl transferase AbiEii/AbiGii toxin family protein [Candidatus Micrarchaeota archaeon]